MRQWSVTSRYNRRAEFWSEQTCKVNSNNMKCCQKKQGIFPSVHRGGLFIWAYGAELPQRGDSAPGVAMQLLKALLMCGALEMFRSSITLSRTRRQHNFSRTNNGRKECHGEVNSSSIISQAEPAPAWWSESVSNISFSKMSHCVPRH